MAQVMFDTQWQPHQSFPPPKKDPLTPDNDPNMHAGNTTRYSYSASSDQSQFHPMPAEPALPHVPPFQPVKEEPYLYQFQNSQSAAMPSGTSSAQNPWDSYLAWDDNDSWAPLPDTSVEEYMGSLTATQAPNFSWDWNNPSFPNSSTNGGVVDGSSIQQSPANPSGNVNLGFTDPQSAGTLLGSTSSWSSVPRLSPESAPSLDSSYPSHRTSLDRSPPRPPEPSTNATMSKGQFSSSSEAEGHTSSSNPPQNPVKGGKKRSLPPAEFVKDGPEGSRIAKRSKKVAHNTVEKRYRMNLNSKIAELRESVPSLRSTKPNLSDEDDNGGEGGTSKSLRKAQVLSKANEYIHELERQARQLRNENEALKKKMALLRTVAAAEEPDASPESFTTSPSSAVSAAQPVQRRVAKGFRPLAMQPTKAQGTNYRAVKGNTMNKALMGCLAGLTVFEGMNDHQQSASSQRQGLFAIPFQFVHYLANNRPLVHAPGLGSVNLSLLTILKIVLVWTTLINILSPSFFERTQSSQKGKSQWIARLHSVPPLASAVEVRQKAWLTSIQTVWVPRRNLILELAALALKMIKIFIRSVIGWKGYAAITGFTEADEIARIKAWDIALDSQLTGGDPEICLDRLALTFLASLTLPTAPGRSALKALHIYVLCKGLESKSLIRWFGMQRFISSVATSFWSKARDLNNSVHPDALPSEPMAESEVLPEYIKVLLEQPSEDIFTYDVKQRAYNLAYNKSTTDDIPFRDEGSENVVADFSIRSPLDALAAWWSSKVLRRALLLLIEDPENERDIMDDLSLALQSAPPASGAQLRATVAIAAFQSQNRQSNINVAIQMMDIRPSSSSKPNSVLASSSMIAGANSPDIRIALRCAMLSTAISAPKAPASLSPPILLKSIASILSNSDQDVTLLGFIAAYTTLQTLSKHEKLFDSMQEDIEKAAAGLRILVGGEAGSSWNLGGETVKKCVGISLKVCKRAAGIEDEIKAEGRFSDQGYASGMDFDAEEPVEVEVEVEVAR